MIFNRIKLVGRNTIDLNIHNVSTTDRYILKAVDGLGPSELDVFISNLAMEGVDGIYQGRQVQKKQPVFLLQLNPSVALSEPVSSLRDELYSLLSPGLVTIQILLNDTIIAKIDGHVKRIEAPLFSKIPQAQITFSCLSSYLTAPSFINYNPGAVWNMDSDNPGSVDVGFHLYGEVLTSFPTLTIHENYSGAPIYFSVGSDTDAIFLPGDLITIDTTPGARQVLRFPGGDSVNFQSLMKYVNPVLGWPMVPPGEYTWLVLPAGNVNWQVFKYKPRWWGV